MRRSGKRLLAALLCLTMVLTLLPMTALAATVENQADAQVQSDVDKNASPRAAVYPDGAITDEWKQDPNTVRGTGSLCEKTDDGRLHLKATSTNTNNGGSNNNPPAMFINETMNAALAASTEEEKTLSFDIEAVGASVSTNPLFGIYLNYKSETNAVYGKAICVDTNGAHWFHQDYYPGADNWGDIVSGSTAFGVDAKHHLELKWTDDNITSFKIDDTVLVSSNINMSGVKTNLGQLDSVGFKVGSHTNTNSVGDFYISNVHYTGQKEVTSYTLSGTVKDAAGVAVAGATVSDTAHKLTTTTDATGAYSFTVPAGTYNLTASKAGYTNGTKQVVVSNSNMTGQDITITLLPKVSGTVVSGTDKIGGATVTLTKGTGTTAVTQTAVTDAQGAYEFIGVTAGSYTINVSAVGYADATKNITVASADVVVDPINLTMDMSNILVLESSDMSVWVDKNFPRVIQYQLKDGLKMDGQKEEINTIKINGTNATLGTITSVLSADKKTVTYTIPMTAPVAATMTARLTVDNEVNKEGSSSAGRTLGFYIDNVEYAGADAAAKAAARLANPVKNIEIPNHSLVSVNSTQAGAKVTGAAANGNNTVRTNDVTYLAEKNKTMNWSGAYFAAFVSNDSLAAGITSNSSLNGGIAATSNAVNRVTFVSDGSNVTIGLSSVAWPYDYLLSDSNPSDNGTILDHTVDLTAEQKVINPALREQPFVKVVIAPDLNEDNVVDWQDGAIALRETVMHIPNNSQSVKDRVNTRIALNFGSQAQNPFLTSLDNAKRVALHTDGLGQAILLKGYANEGHDSGHPDYADVGTRMGGYTDFNTMLQEGKKIGAYFGIHVNAGELYTEAKALTDEMVYYRANGTVKWGWHWHDTAVSFKTLYDYGSGARQSRFQNLWDKGGKDLEFIYVDIWGNATGGTDDSWQTRQLSNEITKFVGDGNWRIAQEWAWANPYDSTFQHWTTDFTYGDYTNKGALNSAVIRFLLNEYKDSFPADFASYGGASNAPLLGGPAMQGFEGWQGDGEYDLSIYNTFNQMVPTKFLQHYEITNWTTAEEPVLMPYNAGGAGGSRNISTTANWKPEVQIKLSNGTDKIVVTRGIDGNLKTDFGMDTVEKFLEGETEYRSRVITLNDKVILKGAPASASEDNTFPASKATLEYLIPWYWTTDGQTVSADNEKLYYWNGNANATTSSEWELPNGWENLQSVIIYELSDQGRGEAVTVNVSDGKVTFSNIKANTPYVVVKGEEGAKAPAISYTAPGQHATDPSFNDASLSAWTKAGRGEATKINSTTGISVLKMTGEVSISQTLTEMTAGKKYIAYVAVENRSNAKAYINVKDSENNVLASNYTTLSIARNYISGNSLNNSHGVELDGSYMQNMYVFFTMPAYGDVTLTLGRESGAANDTGNVYFDSLRIIEVTENGYGDDYGYTYNEDGSISGLTQNFEHAAQGEWPFVVGPVEGVQDNRQHLSEKHEPYTQSGWNIKEVDDVLDGNWSLKTHGISGNGSLVYQTIPQNFCFEPGKTYIVSFDYQMGCENLVQVVIGNGAWNGVSNCETVALSMAKGAGFKGYPDAGIAAGSGSKTCTFVVIGDESGQTWFGIATAGGSFNNTGMPDKDGYGLYYSGRGDFILDNLRISTSEINLAELSNLVNAANHMDEGSYVAADGYDGTTEEAWAAFVEARTAAQEVLSDMSSTQEQVDAARDALQAAMNNLKKIIVVIAGTVTGVDGAPVEGATVTLENTSYRSLGLTATTNSEGKFEFRSTDEVDLVVSPYKLKVLATGYQVASVSAAEITKEEPASNTDIALTVEAPGAYVNNFDNGDVSMMGALTDTEDIPTWEAVNYNGSGALKVTFNSRAGETRGINNVVDKTIKIKDGTVSFDITGLTNTNRLGLTLRATGPNDRIFVGQEDSVAKWFWEWWNAGDNSWYSGNMTREIGVYPGETRRVRVEMDGQRVQIFIDGIQIFDETMTGAPDEPGWVGINMRNNAGTSYIMDNLRIVSRDEQQAGTYTIAGTVTVKDKAIPGAAIDVYKGDELVTSTTTNAAGQYMTQPLEAGTYSVRASADDYSTVTETVTVTDANITDKNFTLAVDKTALQALYNEASEKKAEDYTDESFADLTAALAHAKAVLDDADATASEVRAARIALLSAVDALVDRPPEKFDITLGTVTGISASKVTIDKTSAEAGETVTVSIADLPSNSTVAVKANGTAATKADGANKWTFTMPEAAVTVTVTVTTQSSSGGGTWRPFPGTSTETNYNDDGSVTTIVTDRRTGTVTETTVKPDGSEVEKVTSDESVKLTVTDATGEVLIQAEIPAEIPEVETRFTDVPAGHWADEAIHEMAALEIVNGVGDGKFNMNAPMTRGMLATVLFRLSNGQEGYPMDFYDVDSNKYYAEAVAWAARAGVVQGISDTHFAPDNNITREQLATMLYRYATLLGLDTTVNSSALNGFADKGGVHSWASDAMAWCVANGIITGTSSNTLSAGNLATRAQVAVMLQRFINLMK